MIDSPDDVGSGSTPGPLRTAAQVATMIGGLGALASLLNAGRRTPALLLIMFVGWVLGPFVVLAWANAVSQRWSKPARTTLHVLTLCIALGSLAIYGDVALRPPKVTPTRTFLLVPLASLVLMAIVGSITALMSRRKARDGAAV